MGFSPKLLFEDNEEDRDDLSEEDREEDDRFIFLREKLTLLSEYLGENKMSEKWSLFPHTTLRNIEIADCDDSINSVCPENMTLNECLDYCSKNDCDAGYYLYNDDVKLCVPLRKEISLKIDPISRLAPQNIYPILKNTTSVVFLDKKIWPVPSDRANIIYYNDDFVLKNDGKSFQRPNSDETVEDALFSPSGNLVTQFIPSRIDIAGSDTFLPVLCGDNVIFNIPTTSLFLRKTDDLFKWSSRALETNSVNNIYKIMVEGKKQGDPVTYDDTVYFLYNTFSFLTVNSNTGVIGLTQSRQGIPIGKDSLFSFEPRVSCYYCDKYCKEISLDRTERSGITARFKGMIVHRDRNCYGLCKKEGISIGYILLFLSVFIIGLFFIRKVYSSV